MNQQLSGRAQPEQLYTWGACLRGMLSPQDLETVSVGSLGPLSHCHLHPVPLISCLLQEAPTPCGGAQGSSGVLIRTRPPGEARPVLQPPLPPPHPQVWAPLGLQGVPGT